MIRKFNTVEDQCARLEILACAIEDFWRPLAEKGSGVILKYPAESDATALRAIVDKLREKLNGGS